MANPSDSFWQSIVDASDAQTNRLESYKKMYNQNHAYRLGNAYAQYPWVNPQILTTMVLTDNDDLLPQVAEYAAARMAQAGVTPGDIAYRDDVGMRIQQRAAEEYMAADPNGDALLEQYRLSIVSDEE